MIIDAATVRLWAGVATTTQSTSTTSLRAWVDDGRQRAEVASRTVESSASASVSISEAAQTLNADRLTLDARALRLGPALPGRPARIPLPSLTGDLPPGLSRGPAGLGWGAANAPRSLSGAAHARFLRPPDGGVEPPSTTAESAASAGAAGAMGDPTISDPRLLALIDLIERLTGQRVRLLDGADLDPQLDEAAMAEIARAAEAAHASHRGGGPDRQGWGVSVDVHAEESTTATLDFSARAVVRTADGREIVVALDLTTTQATSRTVDVRIRLGDAKLVDPLALDLDGDGLNLSTATFTFDLDADGATETLRSPAPGDAFLALDRDGSGAIESGAELFGPASGSGFADLAALDADGNGWLDEADQIFGELRLWHPGSDGLTGLADAGIGAIALGSVAAPIDLVAGDGAAGRLTDAGIYLTEAGPAGLIGNIDLLA